MIRGIGSTSEFAPFGVFRMEFPPVEDKPSDLGEVQLLTGVNGTGKTRLLSLMAATLGNSQLLLKRLKGIETQIQLTFTDSFPNSVQKQWSRVHASARNWTLAHNDNFHSTTAQLPAFAYSGSVYLTDATISVMAALTKPSREQCLSFERPAEQSKQLLQAITNLKLQAAMDSMNEGPAGASRARSTRLVKALESTVGEITNSDFHFLLTTYPTISLGVRWGEAALSFDLLPDGLRSIIGWLVHAVVMMDVYLQGKKDPMDTEAIFLLDEIESHLHPAWQRKILPAFQHLFPKAQIFVVTHSPFVIASLNHGWIHRLTRSCLPCWQK